MQTMKGNKREEGFSVIIITIIVAAVIGAAGVFIFIRNDVDSIQTSLVDKSRPEWLEEYCLTKARELPNVPFTYEARNGPDVSSPMPPFTKLLPEDKEISSCTVGFSYDNREAYSSLGVEYSIDITAGRKFVEKVDTLYMEQILNWGPGWERIYPYSDREISAYAGNYAPVFMRENPEVGTIEYVEAFFGVQLYTKFTVFEK